MGKKEQIAAALTHVCGWCGGAPISSRRELSHLQCTDQTCRCAAVGHVPNDTVRESQSKYCAISVDACADADKGLHPSIIAVANKYAEYGASAKMHAVIALRKAAKEVTASSPAQLRSLLLAIGVDKADFDGMDKKALGDLYKDASARKAATTRARENDEKRRQLTEVRDASAEKRAAKKEAAKELTNGETKPSKPMKEKKDMTATMTTRKSIQKQGDWKVGAKVVALVTKKHPTGRFNVKKDETFTVVRIEEQGRGAFVYVKGRTGGEQWFPSSTPFFSVVDAAPVKKATKAPTKKAPAAKKVAPAKKAPAAKKAPVKKATAKKR